MRVHLRKHEIDFRYNDALVTADNIMTFKLAIKTIAKRHGLHATFMPKPKSGIDGSGMHINMSLSKMASISFRMHMTPTDLARKLTIF